MALIENSILLMLYKLHKRAMANSFDRHDLKINNQMMPYVILNQVISDENFLKLFAWLCCTIFYRPDAFPLLFALCPSKRKIKQEAHVEAVLRLAAPETRGFSLAIDCHVRIWQTLGKLILKTKPSVNCNEALHCMTLTSNNQFIMERSGAGILGIISSNVTNPRT